MAAVAEINGSTTAPNGNGAVVEPPPTSTAIETQVLLDHLASLLNVVLGATDADLKRPDSLLATKRLEDTKQRCERFANEAQSAGLYIQQLRLDNDENDELDSEHGMGAL
jgi:dynein heavy chain 1